MDKVQLSIALTCLFPQLFRACQYIWRSASCDSAYTLFLHGGSWYWRLLKALLKALAMNIFRVMLTISIGLFHMAALHMHAAPLLPSLPTSTTWKASSSCCARASTYWWQMQVTGGGSCKACTCHFATSPLRKHNWHLEQLERTCLS